MSHGRAAPTTNHWAKLGTVYLSGTKDYTQEICPKLRLSEEHSSLGVHTFVDSGWTSDPNMRGSTSGVATYLLGVNLHSHSCTQHTIALSSGEAELYAMGAGTADSLLIRRFCLRLA